MTTDITELAQREKFEAWAEEVGALPWGILKKHRNQDGSYPGPHYTYMWKAWQAASAELVEALEKAQQVDEELCRLLPPGVEYMDPPDGGDVTPLEGVRRMVADYRQRIAEQESRLNSAEKLQDSAFRSGLQHGFSLGQTDDEKGYEQSMDAYSPAAGIKVEAE